MCRELGASSQMLELGAYNEAKQAIIDSNRNRIAKRCKAIKQVLCNLEKFNKFQGTLLSRPSVR